VVRHIRPAGHHAGFVGDDELLVIADQIALAPVGAEQREGAARLGQRLEEVRTRVIAESIDDKLHRNPAPCSSDQGIAHHGARCVAVEQVIEDHQALLGALDEGDQRLEAVLSVGIEGEAMARRLGGKGIEVAIVGRLAGRRRGSRRFGRRSGHP